MARTLICGFEANDTGTGTPSGANIDGRPIGTGVSIDASSRTGSFALKVALTSGVTGRYEATTGSGHFVRFYMKVTVRPASTARQFYGNVSANFVTLRLNPSGTIAYYVDTTLIGTSTAALTDTTKWYLIEIRSGTASSVAILRIDGVNEITGSPSSWSQVISLGTEDTVADTYTAFFDDLVRDDAAYPGDSKVVLLIPTADTSNTNWRKGAGTTTGTDFYEAVNNLPPGGVASASETDVTNIESASSTGTAQYTATMSTYASKGIAAGDTIVAIQQIVDHGEDIATGTKTGTFELTANPVVSATAFTFGDDGGAHGIYNNAASLWAPGRLITSGPSVTVSTAPTMKLVKTDTTTRVGCVCFMGIYVEYVPAVVSVFIAKPPKVIGQSVKRASYF